MDGRPVMTFPEFWCVPLANAFEDTIFGAAAGSGSTTAAGCSSSLSPSSSSTSASVGSSIMGIGCGASGTDSADSGVVGCVGVAGAAPCCEDLAAAGDAEGVAVGPM